MDMITPYRILVSEMYSSKLYFAYNLLLFALSKRGTMVVTRVTQASRKRYARLI